MADPPTTRVSLLVRIRDGRDAEAWARFVEVYGPLVYEYGRRHGLQDADAADLTQEVLLAVAGAAGTFSYDPSRGAFRSWLFTVARTKRLKSAAAQARQPRGSGDPAVAGRLDALPGRDDGGDEWDRSYRQRLLDWAAERVRGEFKEATWQAFWRTAVGREGPHEVAESLGMSVGAVYVAKSRVLARIREQVEQVRCDEDHLGEAGR
jgi:RNA polymerase sigma factor (sigma-70 family)